MTTTCLSSHHTSIILIYNFTLTNLSILCAIVFEHFKVSLSIVYHPFYSKVGIFDLQRRSAEATQNKQVSYGFVSILNDIIVLFSLKRKCTVFFWNVSSTVAVDGTPGSPRKMGQRRASLQVPCLILCIQTQFLLRHRAIGILAFVLRSEITQKAFMKSSLMILCLYTEFFSEKSVPSLDKQRHSIATDTWSILYRHAPTGSFFYCANYKHVKLASGISFPFSFLSVLKSRVKVHVFYRIIALYKVSSSAFIE